MAKRDEIDRMFLETVGSVSQYAEFGSGRDAMREAVDGLLASGGAPTMHRDVPWLTDVFFRGIVGDGVTAVAAPSAADVPLPELIAELDACSREDRQAELVRLVDARFRQLPTDERRVVEADVLSAFRRAFGRLPEKGKARALIAAWIGKHGPLPYAPFRAWGEDELEAAVRASSDDVTAGLDAEHRRNRDRGLEVLHALAVSVAYGMDRRGVGNVPALHVGGRSTRDGDVIGTDGDACVNVNMVLDTLAMNAFLWFMDMRESDGRRVPSYGPMRVYLEGPATARYLVGMVQDAVAGQRGKVLRGADAPAVTKVSLDEPLDDDDDSSPARIDRLAAEESGGDEEETGRFFCKVIGTLAPRLYRYFVLVRKGTPKMEALKAVGAKSAHFVEREAKALLAELVALKGEDYAELAKLVSGLVKGA